MDKHRLLERELRQDTSFKELKQLVSGLQDRYRASLVQLFELFSEKEVFIPATVFNPTLSTLETVVKYLHENLGLNFKSIAELMNRSEKTIWQAHHFAAKKLKPKLKVEKSQYIIPVSAFADRRYSNLECVVAYLKDSYGLKFSEIAALLKRDQRTVWTVYNRMRKKQGM